MSSAAELAILPIGKETCVKSLSDMPPEDCRAAFAIAIKTAQGQPDPQKPMKALSKLHEKLLRDKLLWMAGELALAINKSYELPLSDLTIAAYPAVESSDVAWKGGHCRH